MTLIMPGGLIARRGYHHLSFSIKKETGEIVEKVEYPAAMPGVTEIEALHIRFDCPESRLRAAKVFPIEVGNLY